MGASRRGATLFVVLLAVLVGITPAPTTAQRVEPGGAPPPGSGDLEIPGYVRVIDGDTIEVQVGGSRVGIGLVGIDTPHLNTDCGRDTADALSELLEGGVRLVEEPGEFIDERGRRLYRVFTLDGRPVARELARRGLVRVGRRGQERAAIAADVAAAEAAGLGCIRDERRNRPRRAELQEPSDTAGPTAAAKLADPLSEPFTAAALAAAPAGANLPGGFVEQVVASGLDDPTALAFLPDGRILVAEKRGTVRVVRDGVVLSQPFVDLRERVNDYWDRGMLGIAVGPNFASTGHVYLLYTYENDDGPGPYPGGYTGTKTARLTRVTASGDTASPSSEVVILGTQVGRSCNDFPVGADCLPSDSDGHSVGSVKVAPDGSIFMSIGDSAVGTTVDNRALRAQSLDSLAGKILHVDPNGHGLSGNPFWNGDPNAPRSKVWALGLRNPFRFNLRPGTSIPYVGDVGWSTWEEINVALRGSNLGWPCYEGPARQAGYEPKPVCQDLYALDSGAVRGPLISYQHGSGGASATGGVFYTGTSYPTEYQGAYIFGDYTRTWIRTARVDASHNLTSGPNDFASSVNSPVDIQLGPDDRIYYVTFGSDDIRRLAYPAGEPAQNQPPTAVAATNPPTGPAPLTVQFSSTGSADPDNDPLSFRWSFGDGTPDSTAPNPSHTYAANGAYTATLTVSDSRGGTASTTRAVLVGASACPSNQFAAQYYPNSALTGSPVLQRCEPALDNRWSLGSPAPEVPSDKFSARWTGRYQFAAGEYTFTMTSDDGMRVWLDGVLVHDFWYSQQPVQHYVTRDLHEGLHEIKVEYFEGVGGATARVNWVAATDNMAPQITINTPPAEKTFQVGDTISFSGSATDREDGPVPASALEWNVVLHHCPGWGSDCHAHPLTSATGPSGSIVAPDHGDGYHLEILLSATDGGGLTGTASVIVRPQTVNVTLNTSPPGLAVVIGGTQGTAPMTVQAVVGARQTIHAPSPQGPLEFESWSDGGAQQHEIVVGTTNTTVLATFSGTAGGPTSTPTPTSTMTVPSGFSRAINIGGAAATIDGQPWLSYQQALASGLTVSPVNVWTGGTYPVPLQPPVDAETRKMLTSAIWRTVSGPGQGFQLEQALPNGSYDVYVTFGENFRANYRALDLRLEGATAATNLGDLPLGGWTRYGPYHAQVADGALTIAVVRGSKGDPHLMGLEIVGVGGTGTSTPATTPTPTVTPTVPVAATPMPTSTPTPTPTPTGTPPASGGFARAINIGGSAAVTIGGQPWLSYPQALANGLSVSPVNVWDNGAYPVPLQPPPAVGVQTMLQSAIWRTVSGPGQGFQLDQALPNGSYDVYVTFGENFRANYRALDVRLEGATAATNLGDLPLGGWARYGPYHAQVADGALTIAVVRGSKGDPHLMGLEIVAVSTPIAPAAAPESTEESLATPTIAPTPTITPAAPGTPVPSVTPTSTPTPQVTPTSAAVPPTPTQTVLPPTATPTRTPSPTLSP